MPKSITKRKAINNLYKLLKGLTKDKKKPHRLLVFSLRLSNNILKHRNHLKENQSGKQDHFKLKLKRVSNILKVHVHSFNEKPLEYNQDLVFYTNQEQLSTPYPSWELWRH